MGVWVGLFLFQRLMWGIPLCLASDEELAALVSLFSTVKGSLSLAVSRTSFLYKYLQQSVVCRCGLLGAHPVYDLLRFSDHLC